jgi:hypothetical protein
MFQKSKPAEKNKNSFKSMVKTLLCIGLPPVGPGLRPVICLAVFSAILLYKQTNTTHPKHFSFGFLDPINMCLL